MTDTKHRAVGWLARWSPVAVSIVALAVWSAFRVLHLANADALLPSLMSTQRLTWFFWGQDRLGNVVPALTAPVQDVHWNMSLQLFLISLGWFALAALFATNHLAGRRAPGDTAPVAPSRVAIATLAAGVVTWMAFPSTTEVVFVFEQLYAFAFAVFLLGLYGTVQRTWAPRVAGAIAVLAAMLINPSLVLYTPFVALFPGVEPIVWHGRLPRPTRPIGLAFGVAAAAFVLSNLAARQFGDQPTTHTGYNEFSLARTLDNASQAFANVGDSLRTPAALVIVPASVLWLAFRARTFARRLWITYLAAALFAVCWTLLFSGNTWVLMNAMFPRYFFPLYAAGLLYVSAAAVDAVTLLADRRSPSRWAPTVRVRAGLAALTLLSGLVGVIAVSRVEIDALSRTDGWVEVVAVHDVDLAVGGYWATWPVVIEARSRGLDVLGVEGRSVAIDDLIAGRIRHDLAAGDAVTVLCTDTAAEQCTEALNRWSPVPLAAASVLSDSPLVIRVAPGG